MVQSIQPKIDQYLNGYANWLDLMLWMSAHYYQVVFSGRESRAIASEAMRQSMPHVLFCQVSEDEETLPLTTGKKNGNVESIYVCVDQTCLPPTARWEDAFSKILF
jgi:uncharacterized protein YyaL (SSP411 family)